MNAHKLAGYFPILEGEEFEMLVEDIRKNGQLEPIVLYKGEILDGVNRYRACERLGIEPISEEYTGDDPLSYVVSINIRRRHMDKSQRAMLATEMLPEFEEEAKERQGKRVDLTLGSDDHNVSFGRSRENVASIFGVSGPTIQRAKRIKEEAPGKVPAIVSGKESIFAVDEELRQAKKTAKREEYNEKFKDQIAESTKSTTGDALIYLSKLREVVLLLPAKIPHEGWSDGSFAEAQAMVEIIKRRLEEWK